MTIITSRSDSPRQQRRRASHNLTLLVLALASLQGVVGCQSFKPDAKDKGVLPALSEAKRPNLLPWREKEPEIGEASQIAATWTDTVLQESGKGATRGFGGRLYFYGSSDPEPILVEGQLVVYAFDETNRKSTDNKPTKRYVFPPEQFALHKSEAKLGVSYSFWLPWDEVGGNQTDVSLIARFEPLTGGSLIVSEQAKVRLSGELVEQRVIAEAPVTSRIQSVQPASHHDAAGSRFPVQTAGQSGVDRETSPRREETTTIKLPSNHRIFRQGSRSRSAAGSSGAGSSGVGLSGAGLSGAGPASGQASPTIGPLSTSVKLLAPGEAVQRRLETQSVLQQR